MLGHGMEGVGAFLGLVVAWIVILVSCHGSVFGRLGEESMGLDVEWVFNTSAQFEGMSFGAGHMGPPTVWDIDDDGVKEVLWGTRRGYSKRL